MSSEDQNKKIMSAEEYSKSFKSNLSDLGNTGAKSSNTTSAATSNTSGMGSNYPVPDVVAKRFNWGACFLNWIWGLGNKTYITLLIFLTGIIPIIGPIISIGMIIWFGIKGNTWAWQNKKFASVEAFHSNQRKWATAAIIVFIINAVLIPVIITSLTLPALFGNSNYLKNNYSSNAGNVNVDTSKYENYSDKDMKKLDEDLAKAQKDYEKQMAKLDAMLKEMDKK